VGRFSAHSPDTDLTLSLETATRAGSLALLRGRAVIASSSGVAGENHSVNLLSQIEALLLSACVGLRDIDLYATAAGPGSFTGLRIGLATIKAFAATFKRPCLGVPTLAAVALAGGVSPNTCALLPAGRGEVFAQLFKVEAENLVTPLSEAEHLPPNTLLERLEETRTLLFAGPGAQLYASLITEREGWTLTPESELLAEQVALLALQQASDNDRHGAEDLHAIYVRPSDAELNSHVKG
jgi:tRNA threonylcarbamoyladenosine biosynthesis protein TsaB